MHKKTPRNLLTNIIIYITGCHIPWYVFLHTRSVYKLDPPGTNVHMMWHIYITVYDR